MRTLATLWWVALAAAPAAEPPPPPTPEQVLLDEIKDQGRVLFSRYMDDRVWDVFVMRPNGQDIRPLSRTTELHEHLPVATPSGRGVFYVRMPSIVPEQKLLPFRNDAHLPWEWEGHLWLTDLEGRRHEPVLYAQGARRVPVVEASGLAAPDEDTVVYGNPYDQSISVLTRSTGRREVYRVIGSPRHLSVAPDGKSLWYAAPGLRWRVFRLDLETREVEAMGDGDFLWPAISRDGTKVAHVVRDRPDLTGGLKEGCIVVRDARDGTGMQLLLSQKDYTFACPTWGPDDKYLMYIVRTEMRPWALRVVRLSDMVTAVVSTSSQGYRIDPHWIVPPNDR